VIVQAVEPEWAFDTNQPLVTAPVAIEMRVQADGTPLDVQGEFALPAEMTRALMQYKMRPNAANYRTTFVAEIKMPLQGYNGMFALWPADIAAIWRDTNQLTVGSAERRESELTDAIDTVAARSALVMFTAGQTFATGREMRARQIAWLVEHAPDAEVLRYPSAWIDGGGNADSNPQAYLRIRQLWLDHFRTKAASAKSIGAAVQFLRVRDPQIAEDLLKGAANLSYYAAPSLGEVYALAALGVQNLNARGVGAAPGPDAQVSAFGQTARGLLAGSTDVRMLNGARYVLSVMRLTSAGEIRNFDAVCADIVRQLKSVQPGAPEDCLSGVTSLGPMRVKSGIMGASVTRQVRPVYPPEARQARVQGRVVMAAIIGKDGTIRSLTPISGPPPLVQAAYDAVIQWQYRPTVIDGVAQEVATDIEVNFTLN
jgi:TonB family protein